MARDNVRSRASDTPRGRIACTGRVSGLVTTEKNQRTGLFGASDEPREEDVKREVHRSDEEQQRHENVEQEQEPQGKLAHGGMIAAGGGVPHPRLRCTLAAAPTSLER